MEENELQSMGTMKLGYIVFTLYLANQILKSNIILGLRYKNIIYINSKVTQFLPEIIPWWWKRSCRGWALWSWDWYGPGCTEPSTLTQGIPLTEKMLKTLKFDCHQACQMNFRINCQTESTNPSNLQGCWSSCGGINRETETERQKRKCR